MCMSCIYRMVGNFRKEFIFAFFASQEPFMKIRNRENFVVHMQSKRQSPAYLELSIIIAANRTVSASVPLTAIAEAIQEIKMPCKHRRTNQTAQGRERKQSLLRTSWVRGYFLAVLLGNPRVPDSPIAKIKTTKISET